MDLLGRLKKVFSVNERSKGRRRLEGSKKNPAETPRKKREEQLRELQDLLLDLNHSDPGRISQEVLGEMGLDTRNWWDIPPVYRGRISALISSAINNFPQNPGMASSDLGSARVQYEKAVDKLKSGSQGSVSKMPSSRTPLRKSKPQQTASIPVAQILSAGPYWMNVLSEALSYIGKTDTPVLLEWNIGLSFEQKRRVQDLIDAARDFHTRGADSEAAELIEQAVEVYDDAVVKARAQNPVLSPPYGTPGPAGPIGQTGPVGPTGGKLSQEELYGRSMEAMDRLFVPLSRLNDDRMDRSMRALSERLREEGIEMKWRWQQNSDPTGEEDTEDAEPDSEPQPVEKQGTLF